MRPDSFNTKVSRLTHKGQTEGDTLTFGNDMLKILFIIRRIQKQQVSDWPKKNVFPHARHGGYPTARLAETQAAGGEACITSAPMTIMRSWQIRRSASRARSVSLMSSASAPELNTRVTMPSARMKATSWG